MKLDMWKIISLLSAAFILFCTPLRAADSSFIGPMHQIKAHASTVPPNGDVNPYGVAVVPRVSAGWNRITFW